MSNIVGVDRAVGAGNVVGRHRSYKQPSMRIEEGCLTLAPLIISRELCSANKYYVSSLRNRLISQKGCANASEENNQKFKAADIKVPLFISNVDREVSEQDIINYVYGKTKEKVSLERINMKRQKDYNAYKVYVTKHKMDTFLDDKLWPIGITFRRFVNFHEKRKNMEVVKTVENKR
ncbi:unnamed protein product, partial [Brenthis ino]